MAATSVAQAPGIAEIAKDPIIGVASVLLIIVSVAWLVVTRLIVRNYRQAALRGRRVEGIRPTKDIWSLPP